MGAESALTGYIKIGGGRAGRSHMEGDEPFPTLH